MTEHSAVPTTPATPTPVSVIGLGPMGRSMVTILLTAGHRVTIWNRTPSRMTDLIGQGARAAADPRAAVQASPVIILSLTDYRAMDDILGPVADRLAGRTIVNLSSDNPDRTRDAARWATDHGAAFLTGGVMVPAPMLGTPAAYVYYSGPSVTFDQHRTLLGAIGEPRFLGSDPGLAQLMYQAQLDIFLSALSGLMHATALAGRGGISATAFIPEALQTLTGIGPMLSVGRDLGRQLEDHDHPGDLSTVTMMGATAEHILQTSRSAGIQTALPAAVLAHYRTAIDDGHGDDNWTRIIDGIRRGDVDPIPSEAVSA
ncbi:NAD(P)-dependent oxidoreductase [Microlunatus soli]|nr:NAD(P)-binding domain-containing protein [Microlunatus soli]